MTPHFAITFGVFAVLIVGTAIAASGWFQVQSFLRAHSSLDGPDELRTFKRVVKVNMYLAIAMMSLAGLSVTIVASGIYLGLISWADIQLPLFVLSPICAVAGVRLTSAERQMKTITINDASIQFDFDHVVARWNSSALPDW